jgi:hypothetical protein
MAVYNYAAAQSMKPPNLKEIAGPVRKRLEREGLTATDNRFQKLRESAGMRSEG